jgi:hypothetical protein
MVDRPLIGLIIDDGVATRGHPEKGDRFWRPSPRSGRQHSFKLDQRRWFVLSVARSAGSVHLLSTPTLTLPTHPQPTAPAQRFEAGDYENRDRWLARVKQKL